MEDIAPTSQQNKLFQLTIRNFVNDKSSHRQVLADSYLSPAFADIDKWVQDKELPDELPRRVHIMDFIWNHYCTCNCS